MGAPPILIVRSKVCRVTWIGQRLMCEASRSTELTNHRVTYLKSRVCRATWMGQSLMCEALRSTELASHR